MKTTTEKKEVAARIEKALHGMKVLDGLTLSARTWVGGEKVRVYLSADGKTVGWVGLGGGVISLQDSKLMWSHDAVSAAAQAAAVLAE